MPSSNSHSPTAEKKIISELLDCRFFDSTSCKKMLSFLPEAPHDQRIHYICSVLDFLFSPNKPRRFFYAFKNLDIFLSASGKRAHFIHTFEVFLVGLVIIKKLLLVDSNKKAIFKGRGEKYIFNTWLISSSAHDLGRPLEVSGKIAERLAELYETYSLHEIAKGFLAAQKTDIIKIEPSLSWLETKTEKISIPGLIVEAIGPALNFDVARSGQVVKSLIDTTNHGYLSSALLLQTWFDTLLTSSKLKSIDEFKKRCRYSYESLIEGLAAISLHAVDKIEGVDYVSAINIQNNPYAFILFLVDNLQDWDRPSITDTEWPVYYLADFEASEDDVVYLKYIAKHPNWDGDIEDRVGESFDGKINTLRKLVKTDSKIGFSVKIEFITDQGHCRKKTTLSF